jgi:hypothetical protein
MSFTIVLVQWHRQGGGGEGVHRPPLPMFLECSIRSVQIRCKIGEGIENVLF